MDSSACQLALPPAADERALEAECAGLAKHPRIEPLAAAVVFGVLVVVLPLLLVPVVALFLVSCMRMGRCRDADAWDDTGETPPPFPMASLRRSRTSDLPRVDDTATAAFDNDDAYRWN